MHPGSAGVVELVDTQVLGTWWRKPWGFESLRPHQSKRSTPRCFFSVVGSAMKREIYAGYRNEQRRPETRIYRHLPKEDIDGRGEGLAEQIGNPVNVPGFRPGKVPLAILQKRFGDAVRGEVLEKPSRIAKTRWTKKTCVRQWNRRSKSTHLRRRHGLGIQTDRRGNSRYRAHRFLHTIELERLIADVADDDVQTLWNASPSSRKPMKKKRRRKSRKAISC